jgi:hypothetical protein
MENPCNKCLVKVNCTQMCSDKLNLQTLLANAKKQFDYGFKASTPQLKKLFRRYQRLHQENTMDIMEIKARSNREQLVQN